jgi:hypothetical protein
MRRLASALGRSPSGVHEELRRLVASGLISAACGPRGTVLALMDTPYGGPPSALKWKEPRLVTRALRRLVHSGRSCLHHANQAQVHGRPLLDGGGVSKRAGYSGELRAPFLLRPEGSAFLRGVGPSSLWRDAFASNLQQVRLEPLRETTDRRVSQDARRGGRNGYCLAREEHVLHITSVAVRRR